MAEGENPELGISITGDASSATRATSAATEGLKQVTTETNAAAEAGNNLGNVHGSAFGKIVTGSRAASGAMRGLFEASRGGIFTIGGLARAFNDLFLVIRAGAAAAGPFALIALAIGVVIGALRGMANHLGHVQKGLKDTGDEGHRLKAALKAVGDESKKELKQMEEDVKALIQSYQQLVALMTEAERRNKEINSSREKLDTAQLDFQEAAELSRARTPAEKERISAKFAALKSDVKTKAKAVEIENTVLASNVREQNANKFITAADDERLRLQTDLALKQKAADTAKDVGLRTAKKLLGQPDIDSTTIPIPVPFSGTGVEIGGDPTKANLAKQLSEETVAATALRVAAEKAAKALDTFDEKVRSELAKAQKEIDDARTEREKAPIDAATNDLEGATAQIKAETKEGDATDKDIKKEALDEKRDERDQAKTEAKARVEAHKASVAAEKQHEIDLARQHNANVRSAAEFQQSGITHFEVETVKQLARETQRNHRTLETHLDTILKSTQRNSEALDKKQRQLDAARSNIGP